MTARSRLRVDSDGLVVHGYHSIATQHMRSNRQIYTRDGDDDVLPPKAKAIDESALNRVGTTHAGYIVQIAMWVWFCQIERRWDKLMLQYERGSDELKRSTCGKGMAECGFKGTHRNAIRMSTHGLLNGQRFDEVQFHRTEAAGIDVVDLFREPMRR